MAKGRTGAYDQEVKALEKAASLDPGTPRSRIRSRKNLATAYYNLALAKGKAGAIQEEVDFSHCPEDVPKDPLIQKIWEDLCLTWRIQRKGK